MPVAQAGEPGGEGVDWEEENTAEAIAGMRGGGGRRRKGGAEESELDLLDVLLELAVVDEGVLPFRDQLRLQFPRKLHHLANPQRGSARANEREERRMGFGVHLYSKMETKANIIICCKI